MSFINKDKNATNSAMTNFSREKSQNKSYDDVQDSEWPSSYIPPTGLHTSTTTASGHTARFIVLYART
jgi:hypothetical protein